MNKLNIFLHIPKTAGTSIWKLLDLNFPSNKIYSVGANYEKSEYAYINLKNLPKSELNNIELLRGHMKFGWHKLFPKKTPNYFTFFREPINRITSHYKYVVEQKEHYLHPIVLNEKMDILDYVISGISDELNNGMVRLLSGIEEIQQKPFPHSKIEYGSNSNTLYEKAIENFDKYFEYFGIQEDYNNSVFLLKKYFNLNKIQIKKVNKTTVLNNLKLSKETEKQILKYNLLDSELYNYAFCKFNKLKRKNTVYIFIKNIYNYDK